MSGEARSGVGRRRVLLRVLVGGAVIALAACSEGSSEKARRPRPQPAGTAATTTTTTTPPITYQVKRGDTLTTIAKFFGVSSAAIIQANQLPSADRITEGQILKIPPAPPSQLVVTPPDAIAGQTFTFMLNGARVGETIIFEIMGPDGQLYFRGSPHTAGESGVVAATYISSGDGPGKYTVVATGDRGTSLRAEYRLLG
jgi:LysM repeat protein